MSNYQRSKRNPPLRVGVGGPVGSGKTTLVEVLCKVLRDRYDLVVITNDIYTKEDQRLLIVAGALPAERIMGVETGGCPHTAIREDASINLEAVDRMLQKYPDADIVFIESGGDNLAATFSPELSDLTIYVIDVAGGEKIPRKGGPGITKSDLLVINKIDLAPYVGASLEVMESDARKMRGKRPFILCNLKERIGLAEVVAFIEREGLLQSSFAPWPIPRCLRRPNVSFRAELILRSEHFEMLEESRFLSLGRRDHTSGTSKDTSTLTTSGPGVLPFLVTLRMWSLKQSGKRPRAGSASGSLTRWRSTWHDLSAPGSHRSKKSGWSIAARRRRCRASG